MLLIPKTERGVGPGQGKRGLLWKLKSNVVDQDGSCYLAAVWIGGAINSKGLHYTKIELLGLHWVLHCIILEPVLLRRLWSCPQECATSISHRTLNPTHDGLIRFNFYFFPGHFTLFQFYIFKSSQDNPSQLFLICTGTLEWYWKQNRKESHLHYHPYGLASNL